MTSFPIPDFVVIGAQVDGEVVLLASKNLTETELREELRNTNDIYYRDYPFSCPPAYDMSITAKVKDYVWVRGKDYPEAWQALFETWSPTPPGRKQLSGRKMLP